MATYQDHGGGYNSRQQGYPGIGYPQHGYHPSGFSQGGYPQGPYPGAPAGFVVPPHVASPHMPVPSGVPQYASTPGNFPTSVSADNSAPHNVSSQSQYETQYTRDSADDLSGDFQFDDLSIRRAFIRKVYSILTIQLLISFGFICLFTFVDGAKKFAHKNTWLLWASMIGSIVFVIILSCFESIRRTSPTNFICLSIFTLFESILLAFVASVSKTEHVMVAVGITAIICFSLTLFAFQTKIDFTGLGPYLFIIMLIFALAGIAMIFIPKDKTTILIYSSIGAVLFSIYLIFDTQLLIGGKHKYSISPEEYIFAALNLYIDIIQIFLYVLQIINAASD